MVGWFNYALLLCLSLGVISCLRSVSLMVFVGWCFVVSFVGLLLL